MWLIMGKSTSSAPAQICVDTTPPANPRRVYAYAGPRYGSKFVAPAGQAVCWSPGRYASSSRHGVWQQLPRTGKGKEEISSPHWTVTKLPSHERCIYRLSLARCPHSSNSKTPAPASGAWFFHHAKPTFPAQHFNSSQNNPLSTTFFLLWQCLLQPHPEIRLAHQSCCQRDKLLATAQCLPFLYSIQGCPSKANPPVTASINYD